MFEAVAAALIAASASITVALIQRARRENANDHALVVDLMRVLGRKIDKIGDKVDRHVEWHMERGRDGERFH
jgi:hypothetical protein